MKAFPVGGEFVRNGPAAAGRDDGEAVGFLEIVVDEVFRQLAHRDPAKRMRVQVVQHQANRRPWFDTGIGRDVGRDGAWPASVARDRDIDHREGRDRPAAGRPRIPRGRRGRDRRRNVPSSSMTRTSSCTESMSERKVGGCCASSAAPQAADSEQGDRGPVDRLHVGADYSGERTEVAEDTDKHATEPLTSLMSSQFCLALLRCSFFIRYFDHSGARGRRDPRRRT